MQGRHTSAPSSRAAHALCAALAAASCLCHCHKVACGPSNLAHPCRPHELYELLQLCEAGVLGVWYEVHSAGCTGAGSRNSRSNVSRFCSRRAARQARQAISEYTPCKAGLQSACTQSISCPALKCPPSLTLLGGSCPGCRFFSSAVTCPVGQKPTTWGSKDVPGHAKSPIHYFTTPALHVSKHELHSTKGQQHMDLVQLLACSSPT